MNSKSPEKIVQQDQQSSKAKILLVDDEPLIRESMTEYLQTRGYDLCVAEDEKTAWEQLKNCKPQIVISDLMLGVDSGLNLFERIRNEYEEDAPCFILMTGFGTLESAMEAIRMGVDDYLLKPVGMEELDAAIQNGLKTGSLAE